MLVLFVGPAWVAPAAFGAEAGTVGGDDLASSGIVVDRRAPTLPDVAAASWLVADLDSGEVLAAKDAHGAYAPASTLKTLTALSLLPELNLEAKLVPTFDDVDVEGSKVGVVERVGYPVEELLQAMLMVSGNDAANVLASGAGGQAKTAQLMNDTAAGLGALDTHAVNPHGLDAPGQVSSAYDLALIGRAGMANADFARWVSTKSASVSAPGTARIAIVNHNKMLTTYPGSLGIKNGYTTRARASFIGAAERDGHRVIVTLMKGNPRIFDEAAKLLDWGFAAEAAGTGQPVGTLVQSAAGTAVAPQAPRSADSTIAGTDFVGPLGRSGKTSEPAGRPGVLVTLGGLLLAVGAVLAGRRPVQVAPAPVGQRSPQPTRHRENAQPVVIDLVDHEERGHREPGVRDAPREVRIAQRLIG